MKYWLKVVLVELTLFYPKADVSSVYSDLLTMFMFSDTIVSHYDGSQLEESILYLPDCSYCDCAVCAGCVQGLILLSPVPDKPLGCAQE